MTDKPRTYEDIAELHEMAAGVYTANARQLNAVADRIHAALTEKDRRIAELEARIDAGLTLYNVLKQFGLLNAEGEPAAKPEETR